MKPDQLNIEELKIIIAELDILTEHIEGIIDMNFDGNTHEINITNYGDELPTEFTEANFEIINNSYVYSINSPLNILWLEIRINIFPLPSDDELDCFDTSDDNSDMDCVGESEDSE